MLKELHIKNFAIIDELHIDFDPGLNILTGETGAGKSIIVDALGLVLGDRSSGNDIRHGKERAVVEAVFDMEKDAEICEAVRSLDVEVEEDELLLKRIISASGKSRCYVNGSIVMLSAMKEIGRRLVDIHGQHEHQSLMDQTIHVDIVDACINVGSLRQAVSDAYALLQDRKKTLAVLCKRDKEYTQKKEILKSVIQDIEKACLKEGEEDELEKEKNLLANAEQLYQAARGGYEEIYLSDTAILTGLKNVTRALKEACSADSSIQKYADSIHSAMLELEDASLGLRDYSQSVQFNPDRLNRIEERLSEIRSVKRKYGRFTIADIIKLKEETEIELNSISANQREIDNLQKEIAAVKDKIRTQAALLAEKREKGAKGLETVIEKELKDLNMDSARFVVRFSYDEGTNDDMEYKGGPTPIYPHGFGRIEFLFSSNTGEPPRPLAKIASGGEISRVMLALKKILAGNDKIPTLIFDEIDSGTGGKIAEMIGDKLKAVSKSHQALCITHLPQIAGKADAHFKIEKSSDAVSTKITVKRLELKERIKELARMSGGKKITTATLKHAEEMIRM